MYEPTGATFTVDFISAVVTVAAYLLIVMVTIRLRDPAVRSFKEAAETLIALCRELDWRRSKIALTAGVLVLAALGSLVAYSTSEAWHVFIFRLNDERTIPTFYNTIQLFVSATLALLLAYMSRGAPRLAWIFFALAFFAAGIDETADIHARFEARTGISEELAVAPMAILILAALAILWRRLRHSAPALPMLFTGGILVVISQIFDLSDAKWSQRIVEEVLELSACAFFILAMLATLKAVDRARPTPPTD